MNPNRSKLAQIIWGSAIVLALMIAAELYWTTQHDVSAQGGERCHRIGAVYMTMNNPFYTVIDNQVALKVDSEGDILMTRDPALSQERQNEEIRDLLEEGIDLLILTPVEWDKAQSVVREVKSKGIPVIIVDTQVADRLVDCTIMSDNYSAGVQCARDMMARRTSARIFLLCHSSTRSGANRIQGFLDTIAKHPEYEVIASAETEGQTEISMPKVKQLLKEYGAPDVIMALNDPAALGALGALEQANLLDHTLVYGVDGTPEAKGLIKEGMMTGSAAQSVYRMGQLVADTVYQLLDGEAVEPEIIIPVQLITKENVEEYIADGWQ